MIRINLSKKKSQNFSKGEGKFLPGHLRMLSPWREREELTGGSIILCTSLPQIQRHRGMGSPLKSSFLPDYF